MGRKIYIVDDDESILEALTVVLSSVGYTVETSTHGKQLRQLKKDTAPDLILLDVLLSESDGRELCTLLKNQGETKHIPILMYSAAPNVRQSVMQSKANDFLSKPFEINDLLTKIEKLTSDREISQAAADPSQ